MAEQRGNATLPEAVALAVEAGLMEARTATPAQIQSYSASDQRATVIPLLKRKTAAGVVIEPKPIANVPVSHPRGGGYAITLPLVAGDVGLLICSDRSLDAWLESGGRVDPRSGRHHQLTDGVFFPGLHHWGDPIATASASELVIAKEDGTAQIRISGGKVAVRGATAMTSEAIVDGSATSLHTALAASLTEIQAFAAAFGVPLPNTATLISLLSAGTWKAAQLEASQV